VLDVTERKLAEDALRRSESLLAEAEGLAHLGSWSWDVGADEVHWSDDLCRIFGRTRETMSPSYEGFFACVLEEDQPVVTDAVRASLDKGTPYDAHYRIVLPDGSMRFIHAQGKVIFDKEKNPIRMFGTVLDITERKQAERKLEESLREKELLLKEVHHRVKNNLQVITSLLTLQSRETDDQQVLDILNESQGRVRSIALVHEKLYQSSDLASIDFADYCRSLAAALFRSYGVNPDNISFAVDDEGHSVSIDAAIPCGLIVSELLSNSLKYAFPDGRKGNIRVALEMKKNREYVLSVCDDGIGLPEGFALQKSESLGLKLVQTLAEQIGGRVKVRDLGGAAFEIVFPIPDLLRRSSDAVGARTGR